MGQDTYMLVFQGELVEGFDLDKAKANLEALFKVSREKVEQLFSLPAVVVKKNLSHELAQQFQQRLQQLGVVTVIRPMTGTRVVQAAEAATQAPAAAVSAEPPAATSAPARTEDDGIGIKPMHFRFDGNAGEYFKIWIVNILLSIVTLGIYSAWAKVRNHRYFYSNTSIGKHSFEYLADPVTILKGRIVAAIFLAAYMLSGEFFPPLSALFGLILMFAMPWLICKSMAFRNRNTAFRNVRFGFDGTYSEAFKAFILWPLAGMLTLGLLMPRAIYMQKKFIVENSKYGTTNFEPSFTSRDFYGVYLPAFGILLLTGVVFMVPFIGIFLAMPLYLLFFSYINAKTTNLIYNNASLQQHGFESKLEVGKLAWLYFSNWFVTAITLGLAMPWAKVRLANYHAECLTLLADGSIDDFVAAEEKSVSSLGEEIGDAFDMDIGL